MVQPKTPEKDIISKAIHEAQAEVRGKMEEIHRSVSDYFPMIKRGGDEKEEGAPEVNAVGWKHDIASRKEREECLR